jgi:hypothetical protein
VPLVAGEEVSLKGSATFAPSQAVADALKAQRRGGDVAVRFPGLASGVIRVTERRGKYNTTGALQAIDVQHPLLEPLRAVKLDPLLAVVIRDSTVTGFLTVSAAGKRPVGDPRAIAEKIRANAQALGMVGMGELRLPKVTNQLEGGAFALKTDLTFKLGGFLAGTGSLGLADDVVTFAARAEASVKGASKLTVDLERRPDGVIAGRNEIAVDLKNFTGKFVVLFAGGVVDVTATARYSTEKLSGELTLLITDAQTARTVAYEHLPPEAIDASAREAAGGSKVAAAPSTAGPKPGPRAIAGWGTLDVHYNQWLTGRALVIVDGKGNITVVGKITPPAKVEFPQTKVDYEKKIFGFEVHAGYGIPVVGEVGLFAGVALFAIAKVSPLTLSKIEIGGTYSTDPAIFNSFSLSANLNISALAGLKLRAEGGLIVTILDHDIKIGAGVDATAGIRGYVDANPVIGYRELADPLAGRRGEFYIHGEAEFAAQPFLALSGDLFVKLVTPWWSPLSDDTWKWPLGELIYPLPGEIGFGADVDYVFGSGKFPTISPKKVDFNADKFMSDLMDDKTPRGSAGEIKKPGRWGERQQPAPAPPPPQLKDSKGPPKKPDRKAAKDAGKAWAEGMKAVAALKARGDKQPFTPAEIEAALKPIKARHQFSVLEAKPVGEQWEIAATMGKDTLKKPIRIKRAPGVPATAPAQAAPAAPLPEKTFSGGGEKHRLFIAVQGTQATPMIQSEVQRVDFFIISLAGSRADVTRDDALNAAMVAAIAVDKLADELETMRLRGAKLDDKRKALGEAENELALHLQTALDRVSIETLDKGYLLEGKVATYGEMPKQSGDRLTPDHQPQNSLLKVAANLNHMNTRRKLFTGTRFSRYDTDDGWSINLHHQRHVWGATYGVKPRRSDLVALANARQITDIDDARKAVLVALRASLKVDADAIEKAIDEPETHDVWSDLRKKLRGPTRAADRAALRARIITRVKDGEAKLRRQALEEFLKP